MSLHHDHPGGIIACDATACTRTRRNYCPPAERDDWVAFQEGNAVLDLCPVHRGDRQSEPQWLTARTEAQERFLNVNARILNMSTVHPIRVVFKVEPEDEGDVNERIALLTTRAEKDVAALAKQVGLLVGAVRFVKRAVPPFLLPPSEDGQRRDLIAYIFEADAYGGA